MAHQSISLNSEQKDCYQEIANIAMGQAADRLARLLDAYILLPVPKISLMEFSDLHMAIADSLSNQRTYTVCQGFVGSGVSGEVLLFFNDLSFEELANLLGYQHDDNDNIQNELVLDASSVLTGSCLQGLGDQLGIRFIQSPPVIITNDNQSDTVIRASATAWKKTLTVTFNYCLEQLSIDCDVLLIFSEGSVATLNNKIDYLLD